MQLFRRSTKSRSDADRAEVESREQQVTMLRQTLATCKGIAQRRKRLLLVAVAALILVLVWCSVADQKPLKRAIADLMTAVGRAGHVQSVDAAYAAYEKGRYANALRLSHPLAEQGDARAQSLLAEIYYHGRGVSRDDLEAIKWFRRAADQGNIVAQFHLGDIYTVGRGVPQNYSEAAKWYKMAADQGNPKAQFNLGLFYSNGQGVPQDNILAHMWFNLAAAHFPPSDSRNRAAMNRDRLATKMSSEEIGEAQKLAGEWKSK